MLVYEDGVWVLVSEPCTDEFVWNIILLFTMKFVNDNIYCHETGKISNCLDFYIELQVVHQPQFFCKINTFPLLDILPQKIIPCFIISENERNKFIWEC